MVQSQVDMNVIKYNISKDSQEYSGAVIGQNVNKTQWSVYIGAEQIKARFRLADFPYNGMCVVVVVRVRVQSLD